MQRALVRDYIKAVRYCQNVLIRADKCGTLVWAAQTSVQTCMVNEPGLLLDDCTHLIGDFDLGFVIVAVRRLKIVPS